MHRTLVVKKIVRTAIAFAIAMLAYSLLPQQVVAQNVPAEEDIIWRLKAPDNNHFNQVFYLDEARFLVANDYSVDIRNTTDGSLIRSTPSEYIEDLYLNAGKTHFTTTYGGKVYVWDVESLTKIDSLVTSGRNMVMGIVSESGRFIAAHSGGNNKVQYHIWDRDTKKEMYINENLSSTNWGYDMAFSGDTLLALAEDNTYFIDLRTMEKAYVNVKGKYTFSPDGTKMAFFIPQSGNLTQNYFRILDVATKEVTEQAITSIHNLRGITFSKDNQTLFFEMILTLHKLNINTLNIEGTQHPIGGSYSLSPQETEIISRGIDSSYNKYLYKLRMNLVTSVEDDVTPDNFTITPNIVHEFATITLQAQPNDEIRIALYSVGGEIVDVLPISPLLSSTMEVPFNLAEYPHLADGQYFLELTINGQPTQTIPFIIQR